MPYSHHSHSGEFCPGHAVDSLQSIIETAISKEFKVFALTEHMPRHEQDHYPEEIDTGSTLASHYENEAAYFKAAQALRTKFQAQIHILVGFESEWCGARSLELIQRSLFMYEYDFFIGSLHHVRGIPIDYDHVMYSRVRDNIDGTDQGLFAEYYDEQLTMLQALNPPVVGHFDLIRLKSSNVNVSWRSMKDIWSKILRNLDYISSYGGILEINTAALRKGMNEPYPSSEICQAFLERQGRFCLSDDSHGKSQVATNYDKLLTFLTSNRIGYISYLTRAKSANSLCDARFPLLSVQSIPVDDVADHVTLVSAVVQD